MAGSPEIDKAEGFYRSWMPALEALLLPALRPRRLHWVVATPPVRRYLSARMGVLRRAFDGITSSFAVPEDAVVEVGEVAGVPVTRVSTPGVLPGRNVIHFHGGGYVLGSAHAYREVATRISRAARATVVLVDFRRAPENPFPAAIEDTVRVYRQLVAEGLDPARTTFSGDSAGGGLVLSALLTLRKAGDPLPASGVLMSPLIDFAATGGSMDRFAGTDPVVSPLVVKMMGALYIGKADPHQERIALLDADLAGLPPLLIQVGSRECLLDDATRVADCARNAGVDVTVDVVDDVPHVFQIFASFLPQARDAIDRIGEFVSKRVR
ncbi:alpha/beta hydrolase [Amycolatopsis silviterrae]|uniref:Alpha/beta hydrolase n=1 Tax=Amycolatopsis silviterrae TaxID=1656914 RepID=A0ABW5HJX5_9PSEU